MRPARRPAAIGGVAFLVAAAYAAVALPAGAAPGGDPLRARQWSHDRIHVAEAWRYSTGRGAVVALLDTGVDFRHPDLPRRFVVPRGADVADPTGCLDNRCKDDGPRDIDGHGTAVAGVVGAVANNGIGIAGIAPSAQLMPVRIVSPRGPSFRALARGLRFAADHGADVIGVWVSFPELPYSLSKAGISGEQANGQPAGAVAEVYAAVEYAWSRGAVIIAAAGNGWPPGNLVHDALPPSGPAKPECGIPAIHPLVLCVGAVDRQDRRTYYSDYRALHSDMFMVGPSGGDVTGGPLQSTVPCADRLVTTALTGAPRACPGDLPAGYTTVSGTTGGTAHVVAVAALLASQGRTQRQILDVVRATAADLGAPGTDPLYGRGRVDALAAVASTR